MSCDCLFVLFRVVSWIVFFWLLTIHEFTRSNTKQVCPNSPRRRRGRGSYAESSNCSVDSTRAHENLPSIEFVLVSRLHHQTCLNLEVTMKRLLTVLLL